MCPIMNFLFGQFSQHEQSTHNFFGMPYQPQYQPRNSMVEVFSIEGPVGTMIILGKVIFATYMAIAQECAKQMMEFLETYQFELATGFYDVFASIINLSTGILASDILGKVAFRPLKLSEDIDIDAVAEYWSTRPQLF